MSNVILLVNAGSSSLKVSLFTRASATQVATANVDWSGIETKCNITVGEHKEQRNISFREASSALRAVVSILLQKVPGETVIDAVGHRVVHGGDFTSSAIVTEQLIEKLEALSWLAPLHNPPSIATIIAAREEFPQTPHIAIFDTAFHRTMRPEAAHYAIPQHWTNEWGIKRYGFHGLSHSYCAERVAELLSQSLSDIRIIVCHLGHGCSAAAIANGKCVDTTMGFTPLEGLMMATRSGNVDPAAILHVQQRHGISPEELSTILNKKSGLLGVSGISADMRQVLEAAEKGHDAARHALSMFCYRVQQAVATLVVSMGGVDALLFTAGIGENSAQIREKICQGIQCLGCKIDSKKNHVASPDSEISAIDSKCRIFVIATREDLSMLREVRNILKTTGVIMYGK